ncbi:MAG: ferredoxin family protein [Phycisphaerae bacterium]
MPRIVVDEKRCKGCERCVEACPQGVISMSDKLNEKGYFFAVPKDQPKCLGCMLCAISCPDVAIEVFVHGTQYQFVDY